MKKFAKSIKATSSEIIDDFKSILYHAEIILADSPSKDIKISLAVAFLTLIMILYFSKNDAVFYANFFRVLLVGIISFCIYCLSDYFWFLVKKRETYELNIKSTENIKEFIIENIDIKPEREITNFEKEIISITEYYSRGYKTDLKRYGAEASLLLILLLFVFPWFFLLDLVLFFAMFFYTFAYENQSVNQAFDDIAILYYCVNNFHRENPEKCEKFITRTENQEIKDLVWLYVAILKNK